MTHSKAIDKFDICDGARSEPTPRAFIRAAGLANLLVATMVFAEFGGMALVEHETWPFQMGLWLVPFVTLVIWATAALLYLLALAPRALRALGRRPVGLPGSFPPVRSGVWDDWLDRPEPNDRDPQRSSPAVSDMMRGDPAARFKLPGGVCRPGRQTVLAEEATPSRQ